MELRQTIIYDYRSKVKRSCSSKVRSSCWKPANRRDEQLKVLHGAEKGRLTQKQAGEAIEAERALGAEAVR